MSKSNKKLRFITTPSETREPGIIGIVGNKAQAQLVYLDSEGKSVTIQENNSHSRPLHCSELLKKLKDHDWCITERKFISSEGGLRLKTSETFGAVDTIDQRIDKSVLSCSILEPGDAEIESFRKKFKAILENMDVNEIYLYNSSKGFIDLLNGSISLDVIKYESDTYTNTIDLNNIFSLPGTNLGKLKVDLSIQYSKSGNIISKDITFSGATWESDKTMTRPNLVSDINEEIRLEYINGVIKLFPLTDKVDEYIISNCTITYGNIR